MTQALSEKGIRRWLGIYSLAAMLALGIGQALLLLFRFDKALWLYRVGTVTAPYYAVLAVAVLLPLLVCRFCLPATTKKGDYPDSFEITARLQAAEDKAARILRRIGGGVLLLSAIGRAALLLSARIEIAMPTFPQALLLLLPIAFCAYLCFEPFAKARSGGAIRAVLGLFAVPWLIMEAMAAYFDLSRPLLSDYRLLGHLGLLVLLLFLTTDLRMRLSAQKPRLYLAITCFCVIFSGAFCLGRMALYLSGGMPLTDDLCRLLMDMAITVYAISRLTVQCFRREDGEGKGR